MYGSTWNANLQASQTKLCYPSSSHEVQETAKLQEKSWTEAKLVTKLA